MSQTDVDLDLNGVREGSLPASSVSTWSAACSEGYNKTNQLSNDFMISSSLLRTVNGISAISRTEPVSRDGAARERFAAEEIARLSPHQIFPSVSPTRSTGSIRARLWIAEVGDIDKHVLAIYLLNLPSNPPLETSHLFNQGLDDAVTMKVGTSLSTLSITLVFSLCCLQK